MDFMDFIEFKLPLLGVTVFQILSALLILFIGIMVTKVLVSMMKRGLVKGKMPKIMADFLSKFVSAILYIVVFMFALGTLGIEVGPVFIGLSAGLGLIIAFGMQDTLNNMFSGVWIATLRPIKMDEVVEIAGLKGKVSGLSVMSTEIITPDNTYITIPNKQVWGSPIVNDTRMPTRRVDVNVGVAYGSKLDEAIKAGMALMRKNKMVRKDPAPDVVVTELADSAITLQFRAWTKTDNYWPLKGWLTKKIPEEFGRKGIEIPFPQLDVHMDRE